jgi:FAD/FMN-containing dehydrogenase
VNADGTTIEDLDGHSTQSNDTSLFWVIRGGGGGTWGVVTQFTFKLHYAPQRFRNIVVAWALSYRGQ